MNLRAMLSESLGWTPAKDHPVNNRRVIVRMKDGTVIDAPADSINWNAATEFRCPPRPDMQGLNFGKRKRGGKITFE